MMLLLSLLKVMIVGFNFWYMSKDDTISTMNVVPLNKKAGLL